MFFSRKENFAFPTYPPSKFTKKFLTLSFENKYDYKVEENVKHQVRALITARKIENIDNFANAREVRNLFEEIITNQARRISGMENPTGEDMMTITLEDLMDEHSHKEDDGNLGESEKDPE